METLTKAHETCFCWIVYCFRWIAVVYIPYPHIGNTNSTFWMEQTQIWKWPSCLQSTAIFYFTSFAWYSPLTICQDFRDMRPIIILDARCFNHFGIGMEKPLITSKWKVAFDYPFVKKEFYHVHFPTSAHQKKYLFSRNASLVNWVSEKNSPFWILLIDNLSVHQIVVVSTLRVPEVPSLFKNS